MLFDYNKFKEIYDIHAGNYNEFYLSFGIFSLVMTQILIQKFLYTAKI